MPPKQEGQLDHLTGARFLGALWVVCAHYLPKGPLVLLKSTPVQVGGGFLNAAVLRENAAVDFFVVLSGFITHWAYSNRDLLGYPGAMRYYIRRLGRTLLTTWASMALWCVVVLLGALLHGSEPPEGWHVVRCFCFVEQWRPLPENWCPSGPSWFVFALLPAWLLYPVLRTVVLALEERTGCIGLVVAALALYAVSFGPTLWRFLAQGRNVTFAQRAAAMYYPQAQFPDFVIGILAAALARRHQCCAAQDSGAANYRQGEEVQDTACLGAGEFVKGCIIEEERETEEEDEQEDDDDEAKPNRARVCALLADASMAFIVGGLCMVPTACPLYGYCKKNHFGWEPLVDHGFALAIACFLYGSVASGGQGIAAGVLGHPALVELGKLSFEVYIFQEPMYKAFGLFTDVHEPEVFMAYLLALFAFAALYVKYAQGPLTEQLHAASSFVGQAQVPRGVEASRYGQLEPPRCVPGP